MGTEATRQQSLNYGCLVTDKQTGIVSHYVEKPSSYVSTLINCGVYVCSLDVFSEMGKIFAKKEMSFYNYPYDNGAKDQGHLQWEKEVLTPLAGTGKLYALPVSNWWSQVKTAGSAVYANRHYLELYKRTYPERLTNSCTPQSEGTECCTIIPDVYIHPTATIHSTAVVIIFSNLTEPRLSN